MTRIEVLVVGATPAGLVAAIDLARREIRLRVVGDLMSAETGKLAFEPRTLEILHDLRILAHLLPHASAEPPTRRRPVAGVPYPDPIVVPAAVFADAARRRLNELGVEVEQHRGLLALGMDDNDAHATFATANGDRETLHASYLVAADERARSLAPRRDESISSELRNDRLLFTDDGDRDVAMQDAYNLTWKLAAVLRGAEDRLLDSYERERLAVRDLRAGAVHYRDSMMSQELGGNKLKLRAGDRVPDARLWSPEYGDIRMFDLLAGSHWTVLGIGSVTVEAVHALRLRFGESIRGEVLGGSAGVNVARGVTVTDRYGDCRRLICRRGGSLLVIRPDGYLGLRSNALAPIAGAYLEDIIGAWSEAPL